MKKFSGVREVRRVQIGIMKYVHNICEKNKLTYFLCAGSMLGAVRHKGYIPWDDDIDIMMPRHDYEKLIKIISFDRKNKYYVFTYKNCPELGRAFAKVSDCETAILRKGFYRVKDLGIHIDVFPYDGLPSSRNELTLVFRKTATLRKYLHMLVANNGKLTKRVPKWRLPFIFLLCLYMDSIAKEYSVDKSKKVTCFTAVLRDSTEVIDFSVLQETILTEFENEKFYILKRYDEYLTNHFGNYMNLPPVSHRRNKHGVIAWWK